MMKSENQIGKQMKMARQSRGWTQKELANKVGVTDTYISRLEKDGAHPSDELCKKLAKVLDLNEREFRKKALQERTSIDIEKELLFSGRLTYSELDEDEKEVIGIFQTLSETGRRIAKEILKTFKNQPF